MESCLNFAFLNQLILPFNHQLQSNNSVETHTLFSKPARFLQARPHSGYEYSVLLSVEASRVLIRRVWQVARDLFPTIFVKRQVFVPDLCQKVPKITDAK